MIELMAVPNTVKNRQETRQAADIRGKRPVAPDLPGAYIPSAFPVIVDDGRRLLLGIAD